MGQIDYSALVINNAWLKADACTCSSSNINQLESRLEELKRKPDVDPAVKSTLDVRGKTLCATFYESGFKTSTKDLIPDIKDIAVHADHVVIVEFVDGTAEKAVLHPDDSFSLEQGISICLTKKLVGGSAIYNKLMGRALNVKKNNDVTKAKKEAEENERKERRKKYAAKKSERAAKKREDYINVQKEAYLRALREFNEERSSNHAD